MGALLFFEETVGVWDKPDKLTLEVVDCHSVPEIRLGPKGEAHHGHVVRFKD